eukprot:7619145-Pyramimonas_sp.AAC.1
MQAWIRARGLALSRACPSTGGILPNSPQVVWGRCFDHFCALLVPRLTIFCWLVQNPPAGGPARPRTSDVPRFRRESARSVARSGGTGLVLRA